MSLPTTDSELHRLSLLYAQAMDERRKDLIEEVFAENGIIYGLIPADDGSGKTFDFKIEGRQTIAEMAAGLGTTGSFGKTLHIVMNHTATVDGDTAKATTYGVAYHMLKASPEVLIWYIRYYDDCVRINGAWKLARRKLQLEFTQTLPVTAGPV
jgi:hypothetical protein